MMEKFVVSARKYRPRAFEDVVGQEAITNTLLNAIKNNHLAQSFLFCGPRGVGKTTCARILAKTINVDASPELANEDFSFNIFEMDAASNNSVDDIRNLTDQVNYPPQVGKYKVYIIDEVHMLSTQAFNAFLKTLEEPPSYAIFILATTEKHKILPTILSRCQVFDFKRITINDIVSHLQNIATREGIETEQDALHIIAQKADGALRDALSIFDQIVSFSGKSVTYQSVIDNLNILDYDYYFRITDFIIKEDHASLLLLFDEILSRGFDGHHFLVGLSEHWRNLMMGQSPNTLKILEVGENIRARYIEQAKALQSAQVIKGLNILSKADVQYKSSKSPRLLVELTLLQMMGSGAEEKKSPDVNKLPEPRAITNKSEDNPPIQRTQPQETSSNSQSNVPPVKDSGGPEPKENTPVISPIDAKEEEPVKLTPKPDQEKAPEVKKGKKLSGLSRTGSLSLTALMGEDKKSNESEMEEDSLDPVAGKPTDAFAEISMKKIWNDFAEQFRDERRSLFATMQHHQPVLGSSFQIQVKVHNNVQMEQLNSIKTDLLNYLREQLNNWSIVLEVLVDENEETVKNYLPKDQLMAMEQKNPVLSQMRKQFDLDIDY